MLRTFGATFVFAGAFYLLLIDTTSSPELYAGAAAALIAAAAGTVAWRNGLRGVHTRAAWLTRLWRAIARVPADVFWVSAAAVAQLVAPRRQRGRLCTVPFRHGELDSGADMGRRALAEAAGTLAPNTIIIGIDEEHDVILAHQLRATGDRDSIDVMRLG